MKDANTIQKREEQRNINYLSSRLTNSTELSKYRTYKEKRKQT